MMETFCTLLQYKVLSKAQSCVVQNFVLKTVKLCSTYQAQVKKTFLSTSNVIISQSERSIFLKLFVHVLLVVYITFLCLLGGLPSSIVASRVTPQSYFLP
jgi:hypothetical protein